MFNSKAHLFCGIAAVVLTGCGSALAAPGAATVTSGTVQVAVSGKQTTVTQKSDTAAVSWKTFGTAVDETVKFVQPSTKSIIINRVQTGATQLNGALDGNGQVYIINPNGVTFGPKSKVLNVAGLVASTLDISDKDAAANTRVFSGASTNSVINNGAISTANGGYVAMIARTVTNGGSITTPVGTTALGAGGQVTLNMTLDPKKGYSLVGYTVDKSKFAETQGGSVTNSGAITADGGLVLVKAGYEESLLANVVNNTGVVRAQTLSNVAGKIYLLAKGPSGVTTAGGNLDVSAPSSGDGGFIEVSADRVILDPTLTTTGFSTSGAFGTLLIDPKNMVIGPEGDTTAARISALLAKNNVEVSSSDGTLKDGVGNLWVMGPITWGANTTLTLNAFQHIIVNSRIVATGAKAGLVLNSNVGGAGGIVAVQGNFGVNPNLGLVSLSGANATLTTNGAINILNNGRISLSGAALRVIFGGPVDVIKGSSVDLPNMTPGSTIKIAGKDWTVIQGVGAAGSNTGTDLQGMGKNFQGLYVLGSDIDASGFDFRPITTNLGPVFLGSLNGLGHTISNLTIASDVQDSNIGLFSNIGSVGTATEVSNINFINAKVDYRGSLGTSAKNIGIIAGVDTSAKFRNIWIEGTIDAPSDYSGLVAGKIFTISGRGTLNNITAIGTVRGANQVGGIAGWMEGISGSNIDVNVSLDNRSIRNPEDYKQVGVGGIAGYSSGNNLNNVSSIANIVHGVNYIGGIFGLSFGNIVTDANVRINAFSGSSIRYGFSQLFFGGISSGGNDIYKNIVIGFDNESFKYLNNLTGYVSLTVGNYTSVKSLSNIYIVDSGNISTRPTWIVPPLSYSNVQKLTGNDVLNQNAYQGLDFTKVWKWTADGPVLR